VCRENEHKGSIPHSHFFSTTSSKRMYLQVCYLLASADTVEREFGALESIDDNCPKSVLSMDPADQPGRNGIEWRRLPDFLLDSAW